MTQEENTKGLSPAYRDYERQKCFVAYTEQADWSADLLSACEEVLSHPEFDLELDYARKHFAPDIPLRQKAVELIANARFGIYDLSSWKDSLGQWQISRNVFIELGIAIGLNRPTLLLRHASNGEIELPKSLESIKDNILTFSGETTLRQALEERLPQWITEEPKRAWWSRYCLFGGRKCEYREMHPHMKSWGNEILRCHISDGPETDQIDFRTVVEEVLGRYNDLAFQYLDQMYIVKFFGTESEQK